MQIIKGTILTIFKLQFSCCLATQLYPTLFATPWTVDLQVPLSMGFSRQEHWSGRY